MRKKLLLIASETEMLAPVLAEVAEATGWRVEHLRDPDSLVERFGGAAPDAILLDLVFTESDGIEILEHLATRGIRAPIVLMGGVSARILETTERLGVTYGLQMAGCLEVPFVERELRSTLGRLWRQREFDDLPAMEPEFLPEPPYDPEAASPIDARELAAAIENDLIVPYYQPQVTLGRSRRWTIDRVEVLARLHHDKLGVIPPMSFVPLAERCGLIGRLTDRLLESTLVQLADWRREGLALSAAVNLSTRMLRDRSLPRRLMGLVAASGTRPDEITFELTETGPYGYQSEVMNVLTRLRLKGFNLAMDDFGTGFSSLVQLHRLPFNELKIDKSFVMRALRNSECRSIISSTIVLAQSIGLEVCAEGVENRETMELLYSLGCTVAQGFYVSPAVMGTEIPAIVEGWYQSTDAGGGVRIATPSW